MGKDKAPFDNWPRTPEAHFRLYFFAAVSHLFHRLEETFESQEAVLSEWPFLAGYFRELSGHEPAEANVETAADWWEKILTGWEEDETSHLPLRTLRQTYGFDHRAMTLLFCLILPDEDARFGLLFEAMSGRNGKNRPAIGLLCSLWRSADGSNHARINLKRFQELGLADFSDTDTPRADWAVKIPTVLAEVMRGDPDLAASWAKYRGPQELLSLSELIINDELRRNLNAIALRLEPNDSGAIVVRGPERNGRKTILGALARHLGKGLLEIEVSDSAEDRWRHAGPL